MIPKGMSLCFITEVSDKWSCRDSRNP